MNGYSRKPVAHFFSPALIGRLVVAGLLAAAIAGFLSIYREYLTPEKITAAEATLRRWYAESPAEVLLIAFLLYTVATGLSLPIATILSLSYAWILGWAAVAVLNLAAACGATLAFLSARFLFRDWVQRRFGDKLRLINEGFQRDGTYYIVFLRMVAVFPFVVVNLVLGLVPITVRTYFFATMLGMLPLNFAFVYLGRQIPSTEEFLREGFQSLIAWPILLGIGLIGLIPLSLRLVMQRYRQKSLAKG